MRGDAGQRSCVRGDHLKIAIGLLAAATATAVVLFLGCQSLQRQTLFYPSHHSNDNGLERWTHGDVLIGFLRPVADPQNIWLMVHGNAGQASDRVYALARFSSRDAVYILEYPGYGSRAGKPSREAFDKAAREAYALLRAQYPGKPVCVAAESIGSGPASVLAREPRPPDKLVFLVPFDDLKSVARDHVSSSVPVGTILAGSWNNVEALGDYTGPMEVFGAERDQVIPVDHARRLAASRSQAKFHLIPGGHNDWSDQDGVQIRYP